VSQGPFLPSLVFVGLFIFPLGGGTGQTDRQTDGQDQHMMGLPSRKDGPIKTYRVVHKKRGTLLLSISSLIIDRFSKFFHRHTL